MKFIIIAVCLFGAAFATSIEPTKHFLGGWKILPVDDPTVVQLAAKGVECYNKNSNNIYYNKLIKIKKAASEIVAGMLYEIKFLIGATDCVKSEPDASSCKVSPNAIPKLCTYHFWIKSWSGFEQITQVSCVPV
ncbi:cystatin-1-like [Tetranychus urticae]|uniref:Cystatin domain-containing protein n=1 Tax=Tetranychus urticae TaxID=32264 RepID=T1K833_TETUR|nr:cystatin-1-like [Tetranychus urticae]